MVKGKYVRIRVIMECINCVKKKVSMRNRLEFLDIPTQKNRNNTPRQLEFKKKNCYYRKHTTHHEINK